MDRDPGEPFKATHSCLEPLMIYRLTSEQIWRLTRFAVFTLFLTVVTYYVGYVWIAICLLVLLVGGLVMGTVGMIKNYPGAKCPYCQSQVPFFEYICPNCRRDIE